MKECLNITTRLQLGSINFLKDVLKGQNNHKVTKGLETKGKPKVKVRFTHSDLCRYMFNMVIYTENTYTFVNRIFSHIFF